MRDENDDLKELSMLDGPLDSVKERSRDLVFDVTVGVASRRDEELVLDIDVLPGFLNQFQVGILDGSFLDALLESDRPLRSRPQQLACICPIFLAEGLEFEQAETFDRRDQIAPIRRVVELVLIQFEDIFIELADLLLVLLALDLALDVVVELFTEFFGAVHLDDGVQDLRAFGLDLMGAVHFALLVFLTVLALQLLALQFLAPLLLDFG